jgi:RNA polymerase sigma-70 factor (ECF subfamily)
MQRRLDRLKAGDGTARAELLALAFSRLTRLARKMVKGYPRVRRWEQSDDVLQNAVMRLHRALEVATPDSSRSFFNLAAVQIRRELIDLSRHYYGPRGWGTFHDSRVKDDCKGVENSLETQPDETSDPTLLGDWTDFHSQISSLPPQEQEVFRLLWYQGLSQAQAAELLGVTDRVVKYRWRSARLRISEVFDGHMPE